MDKPHTITIDASDNGGYVVRVGCKYLVFADKTALVLALGEYLADPRGTEKKYATRFRWAPAEDVPERPGAIPLPGGLVRGGPAQQLSATASAAYRGSNRR